jgi:hypothetical protein
VASKRIADPAVPYLLILIASEFVAVRQGM